MSGAVSDMGTKPLKLLVDTNVWLDYFLARNPRHREVARLLATAAKSESAVLYVASLSLKDVAYLLACDMKRGARKAGREITPQVVAAARETAWACVRKVVDFALVAPVGHAEVLQGFAYKAVHDDFEDDLILGVAYRTGVDYIVTHDDELARRSPIPCLDATAACGLV